MISGVTIKNFKRFRSADLPLGPLTVLTGLNGMGKSTTIQALLLGREAAEDPTATVVQLNGLYGLGLGDGPDVLNFNADSSEIGLGFQSRAGYGEYKFEAPDERYPYLHVSGRPASEVPELGGTGPEFVYLTAERLGPRDLLSVTSVQTDHLVVGEQGQYTAQVLAQYESRSVRTELRHPDTGDGGVTTLRTQVEQWASYIISPVQISAQWPPGMYASVLRFQKPGLMSDPIRPANIGFGFSYALPIIVAGLLAPKDGILIVENPEAHLHPAGQSRLGRFLGRVAGSQVQVVVETHSDHVLNGVRLAIAEDKTVDADSVNVHFFGDSDDGPISLDVNDKGRLNAWPEGFFDQIETDLGRLARVRRNER